MTPERIKEIADIPLGTYQMTSGDMRAIISAADGSPFYLIDYAYSYGFLRGQRYEKAISRKRNQSKK